MNKTFEIQYMRKNDIYCVRLKEKKFYSHRGLTKILHLSMMDYEEKLRDDFNAIKHPKQKGNPCVYFKDIEDAQRVKLYLEGLYIINKLLS